MKNFIKPAKVVTMIAAAAVVSGQGLLVGSLFGFVAADAALGEELELAIHGQFSAVKAAGAGTGGAQGVKAYWNDTTKVVTAVAAGASLIGVFAKTCLDADLTCEVILLP